MLITNPDSWHKAILQMAGAEDLLEEADSLLIVEQSNGYPPVVIAHVGDEVWLFQRLAEPITLSDMTACALAEEITRLKGSRSNQLYRSAILYFELQGLNQGNSGDWVLNKGRKLFDKCIKGSHNLDDLAEALMHGRL